MASSRKADGGTVLRMRLNINTIPFYTSSIPRCTVAANPVAVFKRIRQFQSDSFYPHNRDTSTHASHGGNFGQGGRFAARDPVVSFATLELQVRKELERSEKEEKTMLVSLPRFSKIVNGLRPAELTIFTGPTGCGKTTILSQMSLDYAMQGIRVLWGSFEVRNARLAQIMLQQMAMETLFDEQKRVKRAIVDDAVRRLKTLPLSFMDLFGSTSIDTVLGTMQLSMGTPQGRPQLIILDNLQFMLSGQGSSSLDRWELMDRALANIRHFASYHGAHIILVVHPRKEMDDTPLCLASVSGTAKATQEADNVIIVQKLGEKRYLDVKKNRYYGDLGRVRLAFDPASRMIVEVEDTEQTYVVAAPAPTSSGREASGSAMMEGEKKDQDDEQVVNV